MQRRSVLIPVGAVLGVAVALGQFSVVVPFMQHWISTATDIGSTISHHVSESILRLNENAGSAVNAVTVLVAPGITAILLAIVARAGVLGRRLVAPILVGFGFLSFLYLPWKQALPVLLISLLLAGVAAFGGEVFISLPAAAMSAMVAFLWIQEMWRNDFAMDQDVVAQVNDLWFSSSSILMARWCSVAIAAIPFVGAVALLIRDVAPLVED